MARDQAGGVPARQGGAADGDAHATGRHPQAPHRVVPVSGSQGVQAGDHNRQVNNYFFLGGKPGARQAGGAADRLLADGAGGVPVPPDLVGRDAEVSALAAAWLVVPPEPVAVLGAPGIGKSAVCLAALHDARVRDAFGPRRRFVRCDGATHIASAVLGRLGARQHAVKPASGPLTGRSRPVRRDAARQLSGWR